MEHERLLTTMANELPTITRQLESSDPLLRSAARIRLDDFARMLAPWRGHTMSRRGLLRAGASFAALSLKMDD